MKLLKSVAITAISFGLGASAYAGCGLKGDVNVFSGSFPIFTALEKELKSCEGDGLDVTWKAMADTRAEVKTAFSSTGNPYTTAGLSSSDVSVLQSEGLLRPLDDLVAKYKDKYNIEDGMLMRIDGKIYSIAFMANAQHLMYRKDLFEKHGIAVPKTYDDVLAAAEKLKGETSVDYQYGAAFKAGWNIAQEFNNIFMGYGGEYFKEGSFMPAFNSEAGIKALNLMIKLKSYMSPNALVLDSGEVQNQLRQGKIPMAFLWQSRAEGMDDPEKSTVVGKIAFTGAPMAMAGGNSATTTWWNGVVLPKNQNGNDDDSFQAMMYAISDASAIKYSGETIWLRSSYTPDKYANGVIESFQWGAPSQPLSQAYGLVHGVMGKAAGEVLAGKLTPEEGLEKAEEDYIKAAKEKGYL